MSKGGVAVAAQYGEDLPAFSSAEQATDALFAERDVVLAEIERSSEMGGARDFTPESLRTIERWFFDSGKPARLRSGSFVPKALGFYFGETLRRSANFDWIVQELVFSPGKFGIGVRRGLVTIMLTKGMTPRETGNKSLDSLWRDFRKYAG